VLAFLAETNTAQGPHLVTFQGNVELWVIDHQQKVAELERELRRTQEEVQ